MKWIKGEYSCHGLKPIHTHFTKKFWRLIANVLLFRRNRRLITSFAIRHATIFMYYRHFFYLRQRKTISKSKRWEKSSDFFTAFALIFSVMYWEYKLKIGYDVAYRIPPFSTSTECQMRIKLLWPAGDPPPILPILLNDSVILNDVENIHHGPIRKYVYENIGDNSCHKECI